MIKIDEDSVVLDGTQRGLLTEITWGICSVLRSVSEASGTSQQTILAELNDAVNYVINNPEQFSEA